MIDGYCVNPDVTILLGAFDTNYLWNGEERETVHFISHMVNILVAYSVVNRGKLIYLSSDEVFSGDYPDDITDTGCGSKKDTTPKDYTQIIH